MANDSEKVGQDEIEELLKQAQSAASTDSASLPDPESEDAAALGQDEIEALLQGGGGGEKNKSDKPAPQPAASAPAASASSGISSEAAQDTGDIELLLNQAEAALASIDNPPEETPLDVAPFELKDFSGSAASTEKATIELIRDVELNLKIELGRTHMYLEDVLKLHKGSVVPLDKLAGDPVDIFVNGRLIARGEVLVLNDNFCVRVAELIAGDALN